MEYIKKCVVDRRLGLDCYDIPDLIIATQDIEYMKKCIYDKSLKLNSNSKIDLIIATRDVEYMKACIQDESLKLDSDDRLTLIKEIELLEPGYIYICVRDEENGLSDIDRVSLMVKNGEKSYIKKCMESKTWDEKSMMLFALATEDMDLIESKINVNPKNKIKLPPEMTIGIEIESEGESSKEILSAFSFCGWQSEHDGSLKNGVEVTSPILHATSEDTKQIYIVNEALNALGQKISGRCGGHIHIGADYLTSKQSYVNLMEIWCNTEKILYAVSNDVKEAPRLSVNEYAMPIAPKIQETLKKGTINLEDEEDLDAFINELKEMQNDRYSGINLLNINNSYNTIEFRLANGNLNPGLWIDNINLFGGIISLVEKLCKIQEKGIQNAEDRNKLEMLEKLKQDIGEKEKLEVLIELIGLEPERYIKRFDSNMKFINNNLIRRKAFARVKGPIDMNFKKSKITIEDIREASENVPAIEQQRVMSELVASKEKSMINSIER